MRIPRCSPAIRALSCLLCSCLILSFSLIPGCTAGEVRKQADAAAKDAQKAAELKASIDAAIEAAAALPASEQAKAIHDALPPDVQPKFDQAVLKGVKALDVAKAISGAAGQSATALLAQLAVLKDQLKNAQDNDDATFQTITWALGAAFPVILPFVALLGHRSGQASGAAFVTSAVARGRVADPVLNAAFGGPGHDVMAAAIDSNPRLADVVRANKTA